MQCALNLIPTLEGSRCRAVGLRTAFEQPQPALRSPRIGPRQLRDRPQTARKRPKASEGPCNDPETSELAPKPPRAATSGLNIGYQLALPRGPQRLSFEGCERRAGRATWGTTPPKPFPHAPCPPLLIIPLIQVLGSLPPPTPFPLFLLIIIFLLCLHFLVLSLPHPLLLSASTRVPA